jgi:hypothetical protein
MNKRISSLLLAAAAITTFSFAASSDAGAQYRVVARIRTGTPLEAKGDYRERMRGTTLVQRFNVELNGGTPGASYEVKLNGNLVATVVANALGSAKVEFNDDIIDDNPTDNQPPLPDNFPHINAGDTLQVGTLPSAAFVRR